MVSVSILKLSGIIRGTIGEITRYLDGLLKTIEVKILVVVVEDKARRS